MFSALLPAVDLRSTFRRVATSTWVVTTTDGSAPVGFTAISVASVSVDPPLVSFNVSRTSSSLAAIEHSRRAALHLLAADQADLARRFAGDRAERFSDPASWSWDEHGLPELPGTAARLVTDITDLVDAGDSLLAIAQVRGATHPDTDPLHATALIHHAGRFTPLPPTGA